MKSTLLLFLGIFFFITYSFTQNVVVNSSGASGDASAGLDVDFTNKGLLIPRLTQAQRGSLSSPATSLIIYQTDNTPGYYYNSGTPASPTWTRLSSGTNWGITGNSGTNLSTDFIGTTDNVDFVVKTNNTEVARFMTSTSSNVLGIGTSSPNSYVEIYKNSNTGIFPQVTNPSTGTSALCGFSAQADVNNSYLLAVGSGNTDYPFFAGSGGVATFNNNLFLATASSGGIIFNTTGFASTDEKMRISNAGLVGIGTASPGTKLHLSIDDASTATTTNLLRIDHTSTGTAAAGFGAGLLQRLENASGTLTDAGQLSTRWITATGGSEEGGLFFSPQSTSGGGLLDRMRVGSAGVQIGNISGSVAGTLHVVQPASSSGSPNLVKFTGGAHTTLTASTEAIDVLFDLNRTVQFSTGNITDDQRAFVIKPPTYSFAGASSIGNAQTMNINGMPVAGTNASFDNSLALFINGLTGYGTQINGGMAVGVPEIADGIGNVTADVGLIVFGDNHNLGNQTATLDIYNEARIGVSTLTSATNVRTVTDAAAFAIEGPPVASTNVTFTNPALSLHVESGNSRFDGRILGAKGSNVASASTITLGSDGNFFDITGTTTINNITTTEWTAGSMVVLRLGGIITVKHNAGGAGAIFLNGSIDFVAASGNTLTLVYDGTDWYEVGRKQ